MDEKLLFKYFRGETTSEEEDAILAWVEETPANRKEFKTAFMIFSGLAVYAAKPNAMPTAAPQRRRIWRQVVRYSLRSAAAVILMIGAAYTGKTLYRNALSQQNMSIVVPAGQRCLSRFRTIHRYSSIRVLDWNIRSSSARPAA